MFRFVALLALVAGLAACDAVSTLTDGWKYAKAVESELEQKIGMKRQVGFNWRNGRLERVMVTFPRLYDVKPLGELADTVGRSVTGQFKQTPGEILLAFSLSKSNLRTAAQ
jgi:hypothetical protein